MLTKIFCRNIVCFLILSFYNNNVQAQMREIYTDPVAGNEVYKFSFYSPGSGYVAFRDWIGFTQDSGRTFTKKHIVYGNVDFNGYSVNLTIGFVINGVKAFNQDTVIAHGHYGLVPSILYSINGGNSFKLVYHNQYNPLQLSSGITAMVFPANSIVGYAVDADRILKTTNKGLSWSVVRNDPGSFFTNLEATDNWHVIAFSTLYSTNKAVRTTNAGATWAPLLIPSHDMGKIAYVHYLHSLKGWLCMYDDDDNSYFYTTINGGSTWTLLNDLVASPFYSENFKFVDANVGYSLGGVFSVYKTTDGGKIWEPLTRNNNFDYLNYSHNDLQVLNTNQLWAGGGHGFIEISTNGGGVPLPTAMFKIDTNGYYNTNLVQLKNYSKTSYTHKWFVNETLVSTSYHASYTHNPNSNVDSIKLVVSNGTNTDTLKRYQYFNVVVIPYPAITSFTPTSAANDQTVTITGNNFTGTTAVSFGGIAASSFEVVNNNTIKAFPGNSASGIVSVTTPYGTATLAGFTYFTKLKITSFSPASGPTGTIVTINGTNFSLTASQNIVRIGGIRANVLTATETQLTISVPAGIANYPITITIDNATAASNTNFVLSFPGGCNLDATAFSTKIDSSADVSTKYIKSADLDDDGKPDLISSSNFHHRLCYYRNTSSQQNISFEAKKNLVITNSIYSLGGFSISDLDGDGKLDLCGNNDSAPYGFATFKNNSTPGNISFNPVQLHTTMYNIVPESISSADFNGDGKPDIFGINGPELAVSKNTSTTGNISFAPLQLFGYFELSGSNHYSAAAADLNGDGKKDVILSTHYSIEARANIFINQSQNDTIKFASPVHFFMGNTQDGNSMEIFDIDGDGKVDIAVRLRGVPSISILRNTSSNGVLSFAPKQDIPLEPYSSEITFGDVSGDGKTDLVVSYRVDKSFAILKNTSTPGSISFSPAQNYAPTAFAYEGSSLIADLNIDGKVDVATITSSGPNQTISIYKNNVCGSTAVTVCDGGSTTLVSDLSGSSYQWQVNSGSGFVNVTNNTNFSGTTTATLQMNNITSSYNNQIFKCIVDGISSKIFEIFISSPVTPAVVISSSTTSVCPGINISFTATPVYGGNTPAFQWKVNGITSGNNSATFTTNSLAPNDQVQVFLTSNEGCTTTPNANSNIISLPAATVITPTATISTISTNICEGGQATFNSTIQNGGSSPSYQWQINGNNFGTNSSSMTVYGLSNGSQVKLLMTSNAFCTSAPVATSNVITMTVNPQIIPYVSIVPTATTICPGTTVNFTATPVNGGASPSYQWKINGNPVGTNSNGFSSSTLQHLDYVQVYMTSSLNCAVVVIGSVQMIVISSYADAGYDETICKGSGTQIGNSAISGFSYSWTPSTGLSASNVANPIASPSTTTVYKVSVTGPGGCIAQDSVVVNVKPGPATPIISQAGNTLISNSAIGNQWYKNGVAIPGEFYQSYIATSQGLYTVKVTYDGCTSSVSNTINFTPTSINDPYLENSLTIAPNPVDNELLIKYNGSPANFRIALFDIGGRKLFSGGEFSTLFTLNMLNYSSGTYLVEIQNTKNRSKVRKLIVKK